MAKMKKIIGVDYFLHFLAPSERNYNWQSPSITLYCEIAFSYFIDPVLLAVLSMNLHDCLHVRQRAAQH